MRLPLRARLVRQPAHPVHAFDQRRACDFKCIRVVGQCRALGFKGINASKQRHALGFKGIGARRQGRTLGFEGVDAPGQARTFGFQRAIAGRHRNQVDFEPTQGIAGRRSV